MGHFIHTGRGVAEASGVLLNRESRSHAQIIAKSKDILSIAPRDVSPRDFPTAVSRAFEKFANQ